MLLTPKTVDFLIIGAAKAGTSSMASWLSGHPDVCMSNPKETMFFGSPKLFNQGLEYFHSTFFPHYSGEYLIGDATPAYSDRDRHPGTAFRVQSINPDAKIIYMVRHPLRKVESSWQMLVNLSLDSANTEEDRLYSLKAREGFSAFIQDPSLFRHFVSVCSYQYQLDVWREYFSDSQILVVFLEDLAVSREHELCRVCDFLSISAESLIEARLKNVNVLNERRSVRSFVPSLLKLGLHRAIPVSFRRLLLASSFFSFPQAAVLDPVWPERARADFVEAVDSDLRSFLSAYGKDEDFYRLSLTG